MVHVPEIDLLLFIVPGMDGADLRGVVSIHDHVFLHGRTEDPQEFRVLMWREVLIAKHKNLAIGQHLSEFLRASGLGRRRSIPEISAPSAGTIGRDRNERKSWP